MNIGTRIYTWLHGREVGRDADGNRYFQEKRPREGARTRRWIAYVGADEASLVPPEWYSWLHHITDAPLPTLGRKAWEKPHLPNLTGTPAGYRPLGHDYEGGKRAKSSSDYESWTPGS